MPYAINEHGALMLENVLESDRAVKACLLFVRNCSHTWQVNS
jgi:hypothetical protein